MFPMGQKFGTGSAEWFWLGVFDGTAVRQCLALEEQGAGGAVGGLGTPLSWSLHVVSGPLPAALHGPLWASSQHGSLRTAGMVVPDPSWSVPVSEGQMTSLFVTLPHKSHSVTLATYFGYK